jgi:hypothetical protein
MLKINSLFFASILHRIKKRTLGQLNKGASSPSFSFFNKHLLRDIGVLEPEQSLGGIPMREIYSVRCRCQ